MRRLGEPTLVVPPQPPALVYRLHLDRGLGRDHDVVRVLQLARRGRAACDDP